jgi:hypothetical protein
MKAICPLSFPDSRARKSSSAIVTVQFGADASPLATTAFPSVNATL